MNKTHLVKDSDKARIRCHYCAMLGTDHPADICEHVEWNTGNTAGISFFYYCRACFTASISRRNLNVSEVLANVFPVSNWKILDAFNGGLAISKRKTSPIATATRGIA